ncbi:hypothetical protein IAT38_006898 [Cryptococcus sp. DSM 104549]
MSSNNPNFNFDPSTHQNSSNDNTTGIPCCDGTVYHPTYERSAVDEYADQLRQDPRTLSGQAYTQNTSATGTSQSQTQGQQGGGK